jgi:GNAT superfamily N-acetyltransferase
MAGVFAERRGQGFGPQLVDAAIASVRSANPTQMCAGRCGVGAGKMLSILLKAGFTVEQRDADGFEHLVLRGPAMGS